MMDYRDMFLSVLYEESLALRDYNDPLSDLGDIIDCICSANKLFISGIGKSGLIARKIVSTLSSTGTPSVFIHPTEAIHGDLGSIGSDDALLAISYSGESKELSIILSHLKEMSIRTITFSGSRKSTLARLSDYFLPIIVQKEAAPLPAPTTSTTLTLAMGDALAICLMNKRGFDESDFAMFHPGGSIGRDLSVKVEDLMRVDDLPLLNKEAILKDVLFIMGDKMLGCAVFVDDSRNILGVLSDGDLRRAMIRPDFNLEDKAFMYASYSPKTITKDRLASKALDIIRREKIQFLVVVDNDRVIGILHLHELLQSGFRL